MYPQTQAKKLKSILGIAHAIITVEKLIQYIPSINGRPPNYQDENEYCREYWQKVLIELNKIIDEKNNR